MGRIWFRQLAQIAGLIALAGTDVEGKASRRPVDVVLYVEGFAPGPIDLGARQIVNSMYGRLGITLAWHDAPKSDVKPAGAVSIQIRFVSGNPKAASQNALAYALPYADGINAITVMYERIRRIADGKTIFERSLLAHVLAHEIGHVLEGTTLHSESGVMKAQWTGWDYGAMVGGPLDFTREDAAMILRGLAAWKLSAAPANLANKSGSAR